MDSKVAVREVAIKDKDRQRINGFLFCAAEFTVFSILFNLVSERFALSIQKRIFFFAELLNA